MAEVSTLPLTRQLTGKVTMRHKPIECPHCVYLGTRDCNWGFQLPPIPVDFYYHPQKTPHVNRDGSTSNSRYGHPVIYTRFLWRWEDRDNLWTQQANVGRGRPGVPRQEATCGGPEAIDHPAVEMASAKGLLCKTLADRILSGDEEVPVRDMKRGWK
jgi:hypothetical protein